jgi:seryl-tRNA(Sec) selenium transferase
MSVPDWLNIDVLQTIALLVATTLALLAYRADRDARRDAEIERRLNRVAERLAEVGAASTHVRETTGQGWRLAVAQRNLRSALAATPVKLQRAERVFTHTRDEDVDEALREVEDQLRALTGSPTNGDRRNGSSVAA